MMLYISISFSCVKSVDILYEYGMMDMRIYGMKRLSDKQRSLLFETLHYVSLKSILIELKHL